MRRPPSRPSRVSSLRRQRRTRRLSYTCVPGPWPCTCVVPCCRCSGRSRHGSARPAVWSMTNPYRCTPVSPLWPWRHGVSVGPRLKQWWCGSLGRSMSCSRPSSKPLLLSPSPLAMPHLRPSGALSCRWSQPRLPLFQPNPCGPREGARGATA